MKNTLTTILILLVFAGFSRTVYIDPTYTGQTQTGTITNPFDSWGDFTIQNGNTYLQKVTTTYTSSTNILLSGKNGVVIGSYGKGIRPRFIYKGSGQAIRIESSDNCTIKDFEIDGNKTAYALVGVYGTASRYLSGIVVNNCILHNAHNIATAGFGIHAFYTNGLSIQYTMIRNVAIDGMYLRYCTNCDIGYSAVHDVNKRYFTQPNQTYSSGDGIQFDGNYNGFYLHHTVIARTNGAGNKFGVIFNSAPGVSDNATGVIENCQLETDNSVTCALHIERGNGIIIRNNEFNGKTLGIRIAGKWSNNITISGNYFYNCDRGVGVGATWTTGTPYPAQGTKIFNNTFENTVRYQIWVDNSTIEVCNNTSDGKGVPIYNYGGGSWYINCN